MTADAPELLPCPFCGGDGELITSSPKGGYDRVSCIICGAEYSGLDEPTSIAGWNTRADLATPTPAQAARVLLEALDALWSREMSTDMNNAMVRAKKDRHGYSIVDREGFRAAIRAIAGEDRNG